MARQNAVARKGNNPTKVAVRRNADTLTLSDGVDGRFTMERSGAVRLVEGYVTATKRSWTPAESGQVLYNLYQWPEGNAAKMDNFFGKQKMNEILGKSGSRPSTKPAAPSIVPQHPAFEPGSSTGALPVTPFYKQWWFWPSVILGTTVVVGGGILLLKKKRPEDYEWAKSKGQEYGRRGMEYGKQAVETGRRKLASMKKKPIAEEEDEEGLVQYTAPHGLIGYSDEGLEDMESEMGGGRLAMANRRRNPRREPITIQIIPPRGWAHY